MKKLLFLFVSCVVFATGCKSGDETAADTSTGGATSTPPATTGTTPPTTTALVYADIKPILDQKCIGCHGDKGKEGIDLRTYESIMKGGEHGAILTAGDPGSSLLAHVLRGTNGKPLMPFKQDPLPEADIVKIETWIKDGAKS